MKNLPFIKSLLAFKNLSEVQLMEFKNHNHFGFLDAFIEMENIEKEFKPALSYANKSYATNGHLMYSFILELQSMWNAEGKFYQFPITGNFAKYYYKGFFLIDSCEPIPLPIHVVKDESALYSLESFDSLGSAIFAINKGISEREVVIQKPTITKINIDKLQMVCQNYLDSFDKYQPNPQQKQYIFESAMEAFFGHDVWSYINSKTK